MAENTLFRTALSKAMNQCSHRELCCSEVKSRIVSWGVSDTDCQKIIDILTKEKYIDEERYAIAFTGDKFRYNKWGRIKIALHLRAKNIPSGIIKNAMESIDIETYKKTMKVMIDGHRKMVKSRNQYEMNAKLLRFGLSRGFESSLLYELLNAGDE